MKRSLVRAAIASVAALVGLSTALVLRHTPAERPDPLVLTDNVEDVSALLAERAAAGGSPASGPRLRRAVIPEDLARRLFPALPGGRGVYDPQTFYRYPPHYEQRVVWEEHPDGEWWVRANSGGLRRDGEIAGGRPDLRVLVTGDSHTEGFCNNDETFSARVEASLRERNGGRTVEVLNAAKSGYGFYHYLGVLEKYLPLGLDAFVVSVYGGNDLLDSLVLRRYFDGEVLPQASREYRRRIKAVAGGEGPAVGQVFNQMAYFRAQPEEAELGLDTALRALAEMAETCAQGGVTFLCVYLPPPSSVEWDLHHERLERARLALDLSAEDLQRAREYEQSFLDSVRDLGVEVIDGRDLFRDPTGPCYWRTDFHLNLEGHRRVAAALLPRLEPLLRDR